MIRKYIFVLAVLSACSSSLEEDEFLLENLMHSQPGKFGHILENKDKYQVQIIYSRVQRDSSNRPTFTSFYYNYDPERYFYPASTVKLPASILSLEKLDSLKVPGLDLNTPMLSDSAWSGQSKAYTDSTSQNGLPSIGHYIKKILLVSDNDAHNRLYEFLGQRPFNEMMWEKGFTKTRMTHRLSIFLDQEENAKTNPIRFIVGDSVIWEQPMLSNSEFIQAPEPILLGEAHISGDSMINSPMNFQYKNNFPLQEQHDLLKALFFPHQFPLFKLKDEDRKFIWKYMSMFPSETTYPKYTKLEDHYVKFFLYGDGELPVNDNLRVFNKVGQAYGFLIDNAYIVDFNENVEFLLSAVLYVNDNQTLNDGNYEYERIGFPFLANLGRLIHQYEIQNKMPLKPRLDHLRIEYNN